MSEGLPWVKMILLIALLAGMFVIPAAGIKLHGAYQRRRARDTRPATARSKADRR